MCMCVLRYTGYLEELNSTHHINAMYLLEKWFQNRDKLL